MAVSVDTVYQTVLALANKEQRGYITPQEFNLFANHAQMDIFEQYFYDLNQFKRIPGNQSDYADMVSNIEDKISIFIATTNSTQTGSGITLPENIYRLSTVIRNSISGASGGSVCEIMSREQANKVTNGGPLTRPTVYHPICYRIGGSELEVRPSPESGSSVPLYVSYIRKPNPPNWTYVVVNDKALWNGDGVDFELHPSEQENLVIKIAKLAGVSIKDAGLAQAAAQQEVSNIQQEKA
jgi:hypothetical protein